MGQLPKINKNYNFWSECHMVMNLLKVNTFEMHFIFQGHSILPCSMHTDQKAKYQNIWDIWHLPSGVPQKSHKKGSSETLFSDRTDTPVKSFQLKKINSQSLEDTQVG